MTSSLSNLSSAITAIETIARSMNDDEVGSHESIQDFTAPKDMVVNEQVNVPQDTEVEKEEGIITRSDGATATTRTHETDTGATTLNVLLRSLVTNLAFLRDSLQRDGPKFWAMPTVSHVLDNLGKCEEALWSSSNLLGVLPLAKSLQDEIVEMLGKSWWASFFDTFKSNCQVLQQLDSLGYSEEAKEFMKTAGKWLEASGYSFFTISQLFQLIQYSNTVQRLLIQAKANVATKVIEYNNLIFDNALDLPPFKDLQEIEEIKKFYTAEQQLPFILIGKKRKNIADYCQSIIGCPEFVFKVITPFEKCLDSLLNRSSDSSSAAGWATVRLLDEIFKTVVRMKNIVDQYAIHMSDHTAELTDEAASYNEIMNALQQSLTSVDSFADISALLLQSCNSADQIVGKMGPKLQALNVQRRKLLHQHLDAVADQVYEAFQDFLPNAVAALTDQKRLLKQVLPIGKPPLCLKMRIDIDGRPEVVLRKWAGLGHFKEMYRLIFLFGPSTGACRTYAKVGKPEINALYAKKLDAQTKSHQEELGKLHMWNLISSYSLQQSHAAAINKIRQEWAEYISATQCRFLHEASISKLVNQRYGNKSHIMKVHIVHKIKEPGIPKGLLFEWAWEHNLHYVLDNAARFPRERRENFAWDILCAIAELHSCNYCLRGLSPSSVALLPTGSSVKIWDLSIARGCGWLSSGWPYPKVCAPPEILFSKEKNYNIGVAHDCWSLGLIWLELLKGREANLFANLSLKDVAGSKPSVKWREAYVTVRKELDVKNRHEQAILQWLEIQPEYRATALDIRDSWLSQDRIQAELVSS